MLAEIGTKGSLVGLLITTALLAWQSRAVARQTQISNSIAVASVIDQYTAAIREVLNHIVVRPRLRPYFYEGKHCPPSGAMRVRVLTVGEMFADALEGGLVAIRQIPASESYDDWKDYCNVMLGASPALAGLVRKRPMWWPQLAHLQDIMNASSASQPA
jgi:hypothetical protein